MKPPPHLDDEGPADLALDALARELPDGDPGGDGGTARRAVLFAISRARRRRVLAYRAAMLGAFALAGVLAAFVLVGTREQARDGGNVRVVEPGVTQITQDSGRVTYDVAPRRPGERFVVVTPSAEIEVRGTRFTVDVTTTVTAVDVDHGRVEVREPGGPLRAVLTSGQHTSLRRRAVAAIEPAPAPVATLPQGEPPPSTPRAIGSKQLPEPASAHVRQPDDTELRLFRSAHELHFRRGDLSGALAAWDRYLRAYPRGALIEEARYNRAVCLLRLGRSGEADRDLAALAADPTAFRAREAKLLRAATLRREGRCAEAEQVLATLRTGTDEIAQRAAALPACAANAP